MSSTTPHRPIEIVPFERQHLEPVLDLSLRAWEPVFDSLRQVLAPEVYAEFFPDWRIDQRKSVEAACTGGECRVWVALAGEAVAGFVALKLDPESKMGEIYMVAVDPGWQRQGLGLALTEFALARMKEAEMHIAMVETGGDPGHHSARLTYERAGFGLYPVARYFKKL